MFGSLRTRNYRLFATGQIVSNTGNWLTNVALTLLVLKITGSGFKVGLLAACQYGPILFLAVWAALVVGLIDNFLRPMLILFWVFPYLEPWSI